MNDQEHFGIVAAICALLAAVGVTWAICWYKANDTAAHIAAGYVEMPAVHQEAHWEKRP